MQTFPNCAFELNNYKTCGIVSTLASNCYIMDLRTASEDQIASLPGIGKVKAKAIVKLQPGNITMESLVHATHVPAEKFRDFVRTGKIDDFEQQMPERGDVLNEENEEAAFKKFVEDERMRDREELKQIMRG